MILVCVVHASRSVKDVTCPVVIGHIEDFSGIPLPVRHCRDLVPVLFEIERMEKRYKLGWGWAGIGSRN